MGRCSSAGGDLAHVLENKITLPEGSRDCWAIRVMSNNDGLMRSKRLAGPPILSGMYLAHADGWNIRDNNIRQLDVCPTIWLTVGHSNNLVVGNRHTSVIDEGTNNTFQSVGSFGCPNGPMASRLDFRSSVDWHGVLERKNRILGPAGVSWY
jgi:hypothetical protein